MTINEALNILRDLDNHTEIGNVYDTENIAEAFVTIHPGFEYPDWDYRTIHEFLAAYTPAMPGPAGSTPARGHGRKKR